MTWLVFSPSRRPILIAVAFLFLTGTSSLFAQLYVNYSTTFWQVGVFDSSSGAAINGRLFDVNNPGNIAVNGNVIYGADLSGSVSAYNTSTGIFNPGFINGFFRASDVEVANNLLYVSDATLGTVGVYDAVTGAAINSHLVTGIYHPMAVSISNGFLYVVDQMGVIGKYDASTGSTINAMLITDPNSPINLFATPTALYISDLFSVSEYDPTNGAPINTNFVTGLNNTDGIVVAGNNLYVADSGNNRVGLYDATTGQAINSNFITGVNNSSGLAIVPEPQTCAMIAAGLSVLAYRRRRNTSRA